MRRWLKSYSVDREGSAEVLKPTQKTEEGGALSSRVLSGFVFLELLIWVPFTVKACRNLADHNDFSILYEAAANVLRGEALYGETSPYVYPPLFAVLLAPFTVVPHLILGIGFLLLKIVIFHGVVLHLFRQGGVQLSLLSVAVVPLLIYRSLDSDLVLGNINVYLLALLALAGAMVEGKHYRRGALLFSVAIATKLYPAYAVVALASAGLRPLLYWAVPLSLVLLVLPAFVVSDGLEGSFSGFVWVNGGVLEVEGENAEVQPDLRRYVPGQSLRAVFHRYFTDSDATAHDSVYRSICVVDWDRDTVEWLYRIVALGLAAFGLWGCRGRSVPWVIAWSLLIALLVSPYARKAHFVLSLFAFVVVLTPYWGNWRVALSQWPVRLALLGWSVVQLTSSGIIGKSPARLAAGVGVFAIQAVLLLVALWWVRDHYSKTGDPLTAR